MTEALEKLLAESRAYNTDDDSRRWIQSVNNATVQRAMEIVEQMEELLNQQPRSHNNIRAAAEAVVNQRIESGDFQGNIWSGVHERLQNAAQAVADFTQSETGQRWTETTTRWKNQGKFPVKAAMWVFGIFFGLIIILGLLELVAPKPKRPQDTVIAPLEEKAAGAISEIMSGIKPNSNSKGDSHGER